MNVVYFCKMQSTRNVTVLILLLSVFSRCIYQNEGENFNHISSANKENVSVSFDFSAMNDSIFLSESTSFGISFKDREVYQLNVSLDGEHVSSSFSYNHITFELDPAGYTDGKHELFIDVFVSAETNSLADKLRSEAVNINKSFGLYIDNTPPSSIDQISIENESGALMVKWALPEKTNFTKYIIVRSILDSLGNVVNKELMDLNNPSSTSFHDQYYAGGPVSYQVDIESGTFYIQGSEKEYDEKIMDIDFFINEDNKVTYEWYKSTLTRNKLRYALFEDSQFRGYLKEDNEIKVSGTFPEALPFMQEKTMELRVYPENVSVFDYQHYNSVYKKKLYLGGKFEECDKILYLKGENVILTYKNDFNVGTTIRAYDSENMALLNQRIGETGSRFYASENGKYVYERYSRGLYQIDLPSLERVSKIDLETLLNRDIKKLSSSITVSNNNIMSVEINDNPYVIDFNTSSIIWNLSQAYTHTPVISPNGEYFFYFSSMYQISNEGVMKLYDMPFYTTWNQIFFGNSEDLQFYSLIRSEDKILAYDLDSRALVNTHTYSGGLTVGQFGIDKENGHIYKLRYDSGSIYILELFDKNNFDLLSNQKIYSGNGSYDYYILNNKFYSTKGFYLDRN